MKKKTKTAMEILTMIEQHVNEGTFNKSLYENDINNLKGKVNELSLLKNTLVQLKDKIPEYSDDVDSMQSHIERIEDDISVIVDKKVEQRIRFNDGFNNLMDMINERSASNRKKIARVNKKQDTNKTPSKNKIEKLSSKSNIKKGILLKKLINLVEQQWVTEADFEKLPEMMGIQELTGKIFILTEMGILLRMIPEDMFANDETRQNIISAAQECLDGLIEEEADSEIQGVVEMEQGFGIVGEVMADLDFIKSNDNESSVKK
ncbi:MAG: TyeA family type III secretion system gatekeeper subunit [Endozoicomonas sp. (ex Botrylloides leachii)]|nr:TyeA family type III secretion system gatekeeper subunit [Endozoicomonas sp. (ex Botrylloides leachii)]